MQTKKPFEIILHVGRLTSLQSWVAKKSCHGQTLISKFSIFDYLSNFEGFRSYTFISDQKVKQKAIEIETAFFNLLGNPKGRTLDHFFSTSYVCHNFPYKLIPISMS